MTVSAPSLYSFVSHVLLVGGLMDIVAAINLIHSRVFVGYLLLIFGLERIAASMWEGLWLYVAMASFASEITLACACASVGLISLPKAHLVICTDIMFMVLTSRSDPPWM